MIGKCPVHSLSRDGSRRKHALFPFKPRHTTWFKVEGEGSAVRLFRPAGRALWKNDSSSERSGPGASEPRRGEVMAHMSMPRAAHAQPR